MIACDFLRPAQPKAQFTIQITERWVRLGQYFLYPSDHWFRAPLQNRLVNLCFQRLSEIGGRTERSEERRGTRQVAFGLCDSRLVRQDIDVVRRDIENLVKLSQRFRKTTKGLIGSRVLGE